MRWKPVLRVSTVLVLVMGMALAACGDDGGGETSGGSGDTSGTTDTTGPADTSATDTSGATDGGGSSGSGSGTLVVDGRTLTYDVIFCGMGPDETGNDDVEFSFRANGSDDGRSYTIDASTTNLSLGDTQTVTNSVSMWYDDSPADVVYRTAFGSGSDLVVEGGSVGYEGEFTTGDGQTSVGTGTLEATCP